MSSITSTFITHVQTSVVDQICSKQTQSNSYIQNFYFLDRGSKTFTLKLSLLNQKVRIKIFTPRSLMKVNLRRSQILIKKYNKNTLKNQQTATAQGRRSALVGA